MIKLWQVVATVAGFVGVALLPSCERKDNSKGDPIHSTAERKPKNQGKSGPNTESITNKYFGVSTPEILSQIGKSETLGGSVELLNMASHNVRSEADVLAIIEMLDSIDASEGNRSSVLIAAFGSLSKRGFTSEALGLIEQKFGVGNLRQTVLLAVFANSKLPVSNLIGLADSLDQEVERNIAFGGISHAVSLNISNLYPAEQELFKSSSLARDALGSGIAQALARPGHSNNFKDAEAIVRQFTHDKSFVSGFSKYATSYSLEILWPDFLESPDKWSEESRQEFLRANSRMQPQETVRKLAGWEDANAIDVRTATKRWLESEPSRATSELLTLEFANPLARDNAILEVVKYAMNYDEIDSAQGWLLRIDNDEIRREAAKIVGK
jgi:hypothetical protein